MTIQCPFICEDIFPSEFNKPIDYENPDGTIYTFYRHWDGFDEYYNCQFCKLIGRKRDVFECLNEKEWRECVYYKSRSK